MLKKFYEKYDMDEDVLLDPDDMDLDFSVLDIDLDLNDEDDETLDEKARPPKLKKKQRSANAVKSNVMKRLMSDDSPVKAQINKIFKIFKKEIRKEAKKQGVPPSRIKLNKLTIKQ